MKSDFKANADAGDPFAKVIEGGNLFSTIYKAAAPKKVRNKMKKAYTASAAAGDPMAQLIVGSGSTYGEGLAVSQKPPGAKRRPTKNNHQ